MKNDGKKEDPYVIIIMMMAPRELLMFLICLAVVGGWVPTVPR